MLEFQEEELIELLKDLRPILDRSRKNLTISCPVCGERECSISLTAPYKWGCFRMKNCGERGNIFTILKFLGKTQLFERTAESVDRLKELTIWLHEKTGLDIDLAQLDLPNIAKPFGWKQATNDPFLNERGFTPIDYQHHKVGRAIVDPSYKSDYVIFLVEEEGQVKGTVGRHVWPKKKIEEYNANFFLQKGIKNKIKRYKNSEGTDFGSLIYGYDEIDPTKPKPLVLVEGIFDKRALDVKLDLYNDRFWYTGATFKCFISDAQIAKLRAKNITDLILFYDPDVINAIKANIRKLIQFFNVQVVIAPFNKDPDEMSHEELFNTLEKHIYPPTKVLDDFIQLKALKF